MCLYIATQSIFAQVSAANCTLVAVAQQEMREGLTPIGGGTPTPLYIIYICTLMYHSNVFAQVSAANCTLAVVQQKTHSGLTSIGGGTPLAYTR